MQHELTLNPNGHLHLTASEEALRTYSEIFMDFHVSQGKGLITLAGTTATTDWSPSFNYWRDYAGQYIDKLCLLTPVDIAEGTGVQPPSKETLEQQLINLPPIPGAEYCNESVLLSIWDELDTWVQVEIKRLGQGIGGFLEKHLPNWHQVGRVCFHLAENKKDPEYPFAFIATYAPSPAMVMVCSPATPLECVRS